MFLYETLHVCVCVCVCALVVVVVVVVVVCVCTGGGGGGGVCVCLCTVVILYRLPATLSHALYCCLFLHIQLCKDLVRFLKAIGESTAIVFINVTVYTCTLYIILRLHIIIVLYM